MNKWAKYPRDETKYWIMVDESYQNGRYFGAILREANCACCPGDRGLGHFVIVRTNGLRHDDVGDTACMYRRRVEPYYGALNA